MNRIDWQAYLDGSMNATDRKLADELLRTKVEARQEVEGLKSFIRETRSACLAEPVPIAALSEMVKRAATRAKPKPGPWRRIWPVGLALGAAACAVLWISNAMHSEYDVDTEAVIASAAVSDSMAAWTWLHDRGAVCVVPPDLKPTATITGVSHGANWAEFDYLGESGQHYKLYASQFPSLLKENSGAKCKETILFSGEGAGWRGEKFTYLLVGGKVKELSTMAKFAIERTKASDQK